MKGIEVDSDGWMAGVARTRLAPVASRRRVLSAGLASATLSACSRAARSPGSPSPWLTVQNGRLMRNGEPCFLSGMNYWSAPAWATRGDSGGWSVVMRDLDALASCGIDLVRIMGAAEGPDSEPWRIVPTLQPEPGKYDGAALAGILRLIKELEHRGMYAIVVLNNFWPWSGGMSQYLSWSGRGSIPYPPPQPGGDWFTYQRYAAEFFADDRAMGAFREFLRFFVPQFSSSPAVVWELANEPRGMQNAAALTAWIDATAGLIKTLAPRQLVATGSEGETPDPGRVGLDLRRNHESPHVDIVTCHVWAQNWGWVRPDSLERDFPGAVRSARRYVTHHAETARELGKPLVLEEFGFPRDEGSFAVSAPTTLRDRYFELIYELACTLMYSTPMAAIAPWSWSGATKPPRPGQIWRPQDPFTGDPPHENQGWYSLYADDISTLQVIRKWSNAIRSRKG